MQASPPPILSSPAPTRAERTVCTSVSHSSDLSGSASPGDTVAKALSTEEGRHL
jgi:hypothetical protein